MDLPRESLSGARRLWVWQELVVSEPDRGLSREGPEGAYRVMVLPEPAV